MHYNHRVFLCPLRVRGKVFSFLDQNHFTIRPNILLENILQTYLRRNPVQNKYEKEDNTFTYLSIVGFHMSLVAVAEAMHYNHRVFLCPLC